MQNILSAILLISACLLTGCSRQGSERDITAIGQNDSLPDIVKSVVRAVAEDDSTGFASLVSYPLHRPYPLRDISDAAEMSRYYHTLVDDSLRRVITGSRPEEWSEYGWRGWSVDNGSYLWLDSLIYDIPYLSRRETAELAKARALDLESLPADLRADWIPVAALRADNGTLLRIDSRQSADAAPAMRLLVYNKGTDPRGKPSRIIPGSAEPDGSMGNPVYVFNDTDNSIWTYLPWSADSTTPYFSVENSDGSISELNVSPVNWIEAIQK